MKKIRDSSIRVKLLASFLIISTLLGAIGSFGAISVKAINRNAALMYSDYLKSVDELHEIRHNVVDGEIILQKLKQTTDMNKINELSSNIDSLIQSSQDLIKQYESRELPMEVVAMFDNLKKV